MSIASQGPSSVGVRRSPADVFVTRPVLAAVLSLFIVLLGLRAVFDLPVQQYPRIDASSLVITTVFVGASAEDVQGFVTEPIERTVAQIPDIDYVDSITTAGLSTVRVWLTFDADADAALARVSARLDAIASDLPDDIEPPSIDVQRADRPNATFYISVTSDQRSREAITEYLSREVQPILAVLPGAQRIGLEGARPIAMRIWLDPVAMSAYGVSADEVTAALGNNNVLAPIGSAETADIETDLRAATILSTPEEFAAMIVKREGAAVIRIDDIARVELGSEEATEDVRFDTQESVYLSVWPAVGANELDLAAALYEALDEARAAAPPDISIRMGFDGTSYTRDALREIAGTLAETIVIVSLVVLVFLGSFRTALVPLVAIPISLLGALAAMSALGFSLNLLTILAIVLAVGLVVDDAIVVVENTVRYIRGGMGRIEAALLSVRQLFFPIVAMTITLASVFAPIGFLTGLTGALFKEFAFTLATAVLVSGLVALTLSPVMSSKLASDGEESFVAKLSGRLFDVLRIMYTPLLNAALAFRGPVVFAAATFILAAPVMYHFSLRELAPIEDQGAINIVLSAGPDSTLDYSIEYANQVVEALKPVPGVDNMWSVRTPSGGFGGLNFKPWQEREATAPELVGQAFGLVAQVPGVRAFPILPSSLPNAGSYDVELVVVSSASFEEMQPYAYQLVGAAFESGQFTFADTDLKIDRGASLIDLDRERIADLGMQVSDVARQLGLFLSSVHVSRFDYEGRSYKVIPQLEDAARLTPASLDIIQIETPSGTLVPLSSIARITDETTPRERGRFQQLNAFRVYGGLIPGVTKETGLATLENAARDILPSSYGLDYAGESRQIRQEGSTLVGTLGLSILFVYLLLTAQFQSFRDPLVVLLGSVPLALSGALVFTFLNVTTINIFTQIGLIALVGLVAKNGILIVEFANAQQKEGLSRLDAARQAAMIRLRPVLMTTLATVFGHLPLVLVIGPGAGARNAIGVVVVGGVIIGTIFTLIVVPVLYSLLASEKQTETQSDSYGDELAATPAYEVR